MSVYVTYDDQTLLSLLKKSDASAYTTLFDRYQPILFVYACKITKDEQEAADLVQEVFLNLWEKNSRIEITGSLLSYLYQSVRFKFIKLIEKKKVRSDYADSMRAFLSEGVPTTDFQLREKEMLTLLEQQVDLLPLNLKKVYEMSRKQNMSNAEIADALNISEKTVQNRLSMAIVHLKSKLTFVLAGMVISDLIQDLFTKI